MMLNRAAGTYLHPTPPQTIACSAFYEVTISAKPQHFEFPPHLNGNTARYRRQSKPQELHLRNRKSCPNKRGHLCLGNHDIWRKYPSYIADCAAWHRRFIEQYKPVALVLMGTPALTTFGKVLFPGLGNYWKGFDSLKAVYAAQRETFRVPDGPMVLLMPHASLWYPNAKKYPDVAATAIQRLRSFAS
jgi:hypothetical protein